MVFFRTLSSIWFLFGIVLSVPLAFDVGGQTCGLAFSLSIATFYFAYSTLQLLARSRSFFFQAMVATLRLCQSIIIPSLLIWSLNRFSIDATNNGGWIERTLGVTRHHNNNLGLFAKFFGEGGMFETLTITGWEKVLTWSSPFFQLSEGFCTLLVIQSIGQISRWLVNRERGDSWMIALLIFSGSVISTAVYFLWRLTQFPQVDAFDASLIGVAITCAVILCGWGIGSRKGNPVESSLLFAYIVLSIYQIFTDYQPSTPSTPTNSEFPPLPPLVMSSYTAIIHALSTLPTIIHQSYRFIFAALSTITSSILVSLAYRLFVFYASTRIIPAVRENGARSLEQEPSLEEDDDAGRLLAAVSWYSPSILIAVYTSLLMQHFATRDVTEVGLQTHEVWKWINIGATMVLYAVELYLGDASDGGVTGHWRGD